MILKKITLPIIFLLFFNLSLAAFQLGNDKFDEGIVLGSVAEIYGLLYGDNIWTGDNIFLGNTTFTNVTYNNINYTYENYNITNDLNVSGQICLNGVCIVDWSDINNTGDNSSWNQSYADKLYYPRDLNPNNYINESINTKWLNNSKSLYINESYPQAINVSITYIGNGVYQNITANSTHTVVGYYE